MLANRRTKIVATIGPATQAKENLERAIKAGMNVARLNFSHGKHADHLAVIQSIREISAKNLVPVSILQDLQGPKIRVGKLENGAVELVEGDTISIDVDIPLGNSKILSTDFKELPQACSVGTKILLDDGLMELLVTKVESRRVETKVIFGGILKDRKGMNLPGANLPVECMTEKDFEDLEFGLAQKVDYVALSFVRHGDDIRKLRKLVEAKNMHTKIVAKIEMLEALENLFEIVNLSDAVMVARGDLAVEVGQAQLPQIQKRIISLCNEMGKPVITATQMLDSMVDSPRPTRAEITDVANAVLDGSDALMLSAESASGKYPFKCIEAMHEIVLEVEKNGDFYYNITLDSEFLEIAESIGASASLSALKLQSPMIVCLSTSGKTATLISQFRPKAQIVAVTHVPETLNRLELVWGINTLLIEPYKTVEDVISQVEGQLLAYGLVRRGEKIIMTMGLPVEMNAKTNSMRIHVVGETKSSAQIKPKTSQVPLRYQNKK
jgi:pyruvate kinase